jgi:hypothetical protein
MILQDHRRVPVSVFRLKKSPASEPLKMVTGRSLDNSKLFTAFKKPLATYKKSDFISFLWKKYPSRDTISF